MAGPHCWTKLILTSNNYTVVQFLDSVVLFCKIIVFLFDIKQKTY